MDNRPGAGRNGRRTTPNNVPRGAVVCNELPAKEFGGCRDTIPHRKEKQQTQQSQHWALCTRSFDEEARSQLTDSAEVGYFLT